MKIERAEVRVISPPLERYRWSDDLPDQFQTLTTLRLWCDDGVEGIAGVWNAASFAPERYTAEALRHLLPILIGRDPLMHEEIMYEVRPRVFPQPPGALALIDIALWDLQGRVSARPIYQLLGGARERIPAYASTPMLSSVPAYLEYIEELGAQGFKAIKFHTWSTPDRDLELARAVRQHYPGDEIAFMLDAENNYDRDSALRAAAELDGLGFTWFEAPLPDYDLAGYRELSQHVTMPVLPSGNWIQDLPAFADALHSGAWTVARTDVTMMGGLTAGKKAMEIAAAAGTNCEVMSWGYTLAAAANLHLMLASSNCTYFEQPLPYEAYEYGMKTVIRPDADGYVAAPSGPGLGFEVDWAEMEAASIHCISQSA